jgi:hypothetical protein
MYWHMKAPQMTYYNPTVFTNNLSDGDATKLVPLDLDTPLGLFETSGGNLYLIAEHDVGKVAIVLRHQSKRPFLWKPLTRRRRAYGFSQGRATLSPIRRSKGISGHLPIGSVSSDGKVSSLLCRAANGDCDWIALGELFGVPFHSYDRWRIMINDEILFQTWS